MNQFTLYGYSAGGLAVFTWIDTISDIIRKRNPNVIFTGLSDSGFFIDYKSLKTGTNDYE